jgi:hypothetical protein
MIGELTMTIGSLYASINSIRPPLKKNTQSKNDTNNPYFVIALPRSRTAWLSVFLDCYHEGFNNCNTFKEYKNKIKNSGDCSTSLLLFDMKKLFPNSRVVIIHNTIDSAVDFYREIYRKDTTDLLRLMKKRLFSLDGLHIEFDDIDNRLEEIWKYLKDEPFDKARTDRLKLLNVKIKSMKDFRIEPALMLELKSFQKQLG